MELLDKVKAKIKEAVVALNGQNAQGCVWELRSASGEKVRLALDAGRNDLYLKRKARRFGKERNISEASKRLKAAGSFFELEGLVREFDICDYIDFGSICLNAAKNVLISVLDTLNEFPVLRAKLCFIGSEKSFLKARDRLSQGDERTLLALGLDKFVSQNDAVGIARLCEIKSEKEYLAQAVDTCGFVDGLMLKEESFCDNSYSDTLSGLYHNERNGQSPKGCRTLKALIDHEMGHLLDFYYGISKKGSVARCFKSMTREQIKEQLSEYAADDIKEFVAEAYSEYKNNESPRHVALMIGKEIEKYGTL